MFNPQAQSSYGQNSQENDLFEVNQRKFQVFCRVRPLQEAEPTQDIVISQDKPMITIYNHAKNTSKLFTFHKIFRQTLSQSQITDNLSNEIYANCRSNGNGCLVLSYGVTNSGKTYTILGTPQEPGLLPILINKLSQRMPEQKVYISAVENYIDQFYSLKNKEKLFLKEKDYKFQFQTYQPQQINKNNFSQLINIYIQNRNQSGTNANLLSSRSHAIFKIYCSTFYIVIVDLAGSQRLNKANSDQQQTISINNSLFSLGRCIHAFQKGDKVPYRDHKLTQMFVEFFSPNYKIIMIAHINRSGQMYHENYNVLEYAALSTQIKQLNTHKNKSILKSASKLKHIDKSLQKKMEIKDIQNKQAQLENYKFFMKGMTFQYGNNLDLHLEEQDRKDRQFLRQLKQGSYVSPTKAICNVELERMKVESRIKFRQMIIEDLAAQKRQKMVQCGIITGSSLRKPYEASIRKRLQQEIMKKLNDLKQSQQLQKQVQQTLEDKQQISEKESFQQKQDYEQPKKSQFSRQSGKQKPQTPVKSTTKIQSQSIFKRIMKSPVMYLKSTANVANVHTQNVLNFIKQKTQQMMQVLGILDPRSQNFNQNSSKQIKKQSQQTSKQTNNIQQIKKEYYQRLQLQNKRNEEQKLNTIIKFEQNTGKQLEKQEQDTFKKDTTEQNSDHIKVQANIVPVDIQNQISSLQTQVHPFGSRQSSIKHHEQVDHENTSLGGFITQPYHNEKDFDSEIFQSKKVLRKSLKVTFSDSLNHFEESNEMLLNGIGVSDEKNEINITLSCEDKIISHIKQTQTILYVNQQIHHNDTPSFPTNLSLQNPMPSNRKHENHPSYQHQPNLAICNKENATHQNNQDQRQQGQIVNYQNKDMKTSKINSTQETTLMHRSPFKVAFKTQRSLSVTKYHNPTQAQFKIYLSQTQNPFVPSYIQKSGIKTRQQLRNKVNKERELMKKRKI